MEGAFGGDAVQLRPAEYEPAEQHYPDQLFLGLLRSLSRISAVSRQPAKRIPVSLFLLPQGNRFLRHHSTAGRNLLVGKPALRSGHAWIGLGSNVGDRLAHLRSGTRRLAGLGEAEFSSVYETDPVSAPPVSPAPLPFLNA